MSQAKIEALLQQRKYRQAIDEIKTIQKSQPNIKLSIDESVVWAYRGHDELLKEEYKSAENSFRQALKLGCVDEAYYGIAKALLRQNRLDTALEFIRDAFDRKTLPKDHAVCYLKLLLIKGDRDTVESLITTQSKRFSAPQLHWVRGVLALKSDDPKTAITSFIKVKKPLTRGDSQDAWLTYSYQQQQDWNSADMKLGLSSRDSWHVRQPKFAYHPALVKLAIYQQAVTGNVDEPLLGKNDRISKEIFDALSMLKLISKGNIHDAGHTMLRIGNSPSAHLSEVVALRSKVLTLAGQQAMQQGAAECVIQLWKPIVEGRAFDPRVAVNFLTVLEHQEEYQEKHRLLTRLMKWIEDEAKRDRNAWSDDRRKLTLAHGHCLIGDALMDLGRVRAAFGAVQQAERLCPTSPEVMGRKGLMLHGEDRNEEAIELLMKALEQGCKLEQVYLGLQDCLEETGRKSEILDIRKRYGKNFGDLNAVAEVEMAEWIEALSTQNYEFFSGLIPKPKSTDPAVRACQIFREFAHGNPTGTGKISIHQDNAIAAWDKLLATLDPVNQVTTLQAIALCLEILAKRDKGIAALITRYMLKITDLNPKVPAATIAHLIVLATKEKTAAKLQVPVSLYLNTQANPTNALAQLQLQVRWFGSGLSLRSLLDRALIQEPQNPLLLLAKATTYHFNTLAYRKLHEQGFELARQLQDATALQAFRLEEHYKQTQDVQKSLPNPGKLENMRPQDFDQFFETMIRNTIGKKMPKADLDRLIPILKQKFLEDMDGGGGSRFGGGSPFGNMNPFGSGSFFEEEEEDLFATSKKKKKKSNTLF
jgi:tetratricopeptide (TPR) repeat protein